MILRYVYVGVADHEVVPVLKGAEPPAGVALAALPDRSGVEGGQRQISQGKHAKREVGVDQDDGVCR